MSDVGVNTDPSTPEQSSPEQGRVSRLARAASDIDRLLSRTSLLSSPSGRQTASQGDLPPEIAELYQPLTEILSLEKLVGIKGQSREKSDQQHEEIENAIEVSDENLAGKRERVAGMIESLGFKNWRVDLARLRAEKGQDKNIEDLIETYREFNLKAIDQKEIFLEKDYGGVLRNLQNSVKDLEDARSRPVANFCVKVFTWGGATSHIEVAKKQVELETQSVKARFLKIRFTSSELKEAKNGVSLAKEAGEQRQVLMQEADQAHSQGLSGVADQKVEEANEKLQLVIANLKMADKALHHQEITEDGRVFNKFSVDYSAEQKRLKTLGEKWAEVDAGYGETLSNMETTSKALIMTSAVILGMIAGGAPLAIASPWLSWLAGAGICFGTTVGVGVAFNAFSHLAQAGGCAIWEQDFDLDAAKADALANAKECALMGAGGGLANGAKLIFGGTRLASGLSLIPGSRAMGTGFIATVQQSPSNVYHFGEELYYYHCYVDQMLEDDQLNQPELDYFQGLEGVPDLDRRVQVPRDENGQMIYDLDNPDMKKEVWMSMMGKRTYDLAIVYKQDMQLNFLCAFVGHTFSGMRGQIRTSLQPRVPMPGATPGVPATPVVSTGTSVRATMNRGASAVLQAKIHAFDAGLALYSADSALDFRENTLNDPYFDGEMTDEMRTKYKISALVGTGVGNLHGDIAFSRDIQARRAQEHINDVGNQKARAEIDADGVPTSRDPNYRIVVGKAKAENEISAGTTDADFKNASGAVELWISDKLAKVQDQVSGNPMSKGNKRLIKELEAEIAHIGEHSLTKPKFFTELKRDFAEFTNRTCHRVAKVGELDSADPASIQRHLDHAEALNAEAKFHVGRYNRGEGADTLGPKAIIEVAYTRLKETAKSAKTSLGRVFPTVPKAIDLGRGYSRRFFRSILDGASKVPLLKHLVPTGKDGLMATYLFGKASAVVIPIGKAFHQYLGVGVASAGGSFGGWIFGGYTGLRVMNYVGWKTGGWFGLRRVRPKDARIAIFSRAEINRHRSILKSKLQESDSVEMTRAQKKQLTRVLDDADTNVTKLNKMFDQCHVPRRNSILNMAAFSTLMLKTGIWQPAAIYSFLLANRSSYGRILNTGALTLAYAAGFSTTWLPLAATGPWIPIAYGTYTGFRNYMAWRGNKTPFSLKVSNGLHEAGMGLRSQRFSMRFIRGETAFHEYTPIIGDLWNFALGKPLIGISNWVLRRSDALAPRDLVVERQRRISEGFQTGLERMLNRGLDINQGFDRIKMIKTLEDQAVKDMSGDRANMNSFLSDMDVLIREVSGSIKQRRGDGHDPNDNRNIQLDILLRLKNASAPRTDADAEADSRGPIPDRVEQMLRERGAERAPDPNSTYKAQDNSMRRSAVDEPFRKIIDELLETVQKNRDPREVLDRIITEHNAQRVAEGKSEVKTKSTYSIFAEKNRQDIFSDIRGIYGSRGSLNAADVDPLLRQLDSFQSFDNTRVEIIGKPGDPKNKGMLVKMALKIQELKGDKSGTANDRKARVERADKMIKIAERLEEYVFQRDAMYAIIMGQPLPPRIDFSLLDGKGPNANGKGLPPRVEQMLRARAAAQKNAAQTRTTSDDDSNNTKNYRYRAVEEDKIISREKQLKRIDALEEHLKKSKMSEAEQEEALGWLKDHLQKARSEIIDQRVDRYLDDPREFAGWMSVTPIENFFARFHAGRAKRAMVREIDLRVLKQSLSDSKISQTKQDEVLAWVETHVKNKNGSKVVDEALDKYLNSQDAKLVAELKEQRVFRWEKGIDVNRRAEEFINNKGKNLEKVDDGIRFYRLSTKFVRRYAETASRLGVANDQQANDLVFNLIRNSEMPNDGVTLQMRMHAEDASDQTRTYQARKASEEKLRVLIMSDLTAVRAHFNRMSARQKHSEGRIRKAVDRASRNNGIDYQNHLRREAILRVNKDRAKDRAEERSRTSGRTSDSEKKHPTIWDRKVKAKDYTGYTKKDREVKGYQDQLNWFQRDYEAPPAEAWGKTPLQRYTGWLTGPLTNGHSSLYGSSIFVRGTQKIPASLRWLYQRVWNN